MINRHFDGPPRIDNLSQKHLSSPRMKSRIKGVGIATPSASYTQNELLTLFGIEDRRIRSLFLNSAINRRHLILPPLQDNGSLPIESQGDLLRKHRACATDIGSEAIERCLKHAQKKTTDIAYLCCVTTTGFLTPGISALLCRALGLPQNCARLDVVGMGCNAGLNGLSALSNWAQANPGKLAVMLCVEVCSACYVLDQTMRTSVVNSLFGDGAAALAIVATEESASEIEASILKFSSRIITDAIDAMRYDWDESHNKFNFFLDPDIPYVVGANIESTIAELLANTGIRRSAVNHWIVHSGGKKVIDAIRVNLGLSAHDLRHTASVLRDFGNVSSGSFLFSYQRLLVENEVKQGDYGVMITMGPGSTIESALLRW